MKTQRITRLSKTQIRNFGVKTMLELDTILAVAGLEIINDTPVYIIL